MGKSQKRWRSPEEQETSRLIEEGRDQLFDELNLLCHEKSTLVTSWINLQLADPHKTFEEVACQLARNFMAAQNQHFLQKLGEHVEKEMDEHTVSGEG